ncbi:hydrogenase [Methylococcus sp. EFPC2]|uniref:hydrogenase n=1 Tax=Methylococcus sp. EFPC2 TaxID=2812648 RepID=UPI0019677E2C|nr:hydrogenase [Methylococcus sp. EFPC2]QSA97328.1 hydrogenase [Methylococcus sp. EFPC2]
MTPTPSPPPDRLAALIAKLTERDAFLLLDEAGEAAFAAAPGAAVLLFVEDPSTVPESWDVGVVLPEVLKDLGQPCRTGVVAPATGRSLRARYGFARWPAAVFLRDGGYLGAIEGMKDWPVLLAETRAILSGPVRRPPGLGVEVRVEGAASSCH